jgi:hypothetical protein
MAPRGKSHRHVAEPTHPLERVVEVVSADAFEGDLGLREDRWAQKVRRDLDAKLAGLRRQLSPARSAPHRVTRISAALRALDRPALLVRLEALQETPTVRVAHLELSGLTTDDLRLLVAELEATAPTRERAK